MFERKPDQIRQLGAALYDNDVWRDLALAVETLVRKMVDEPRWALSRIRQARIAHRGDWVDTPLGRGQVVNIRRTRSNVNTDNNTYDFQDKIEVDLGGNGVVTIPVRVLHDRTTLIDSSRLAGFDFFSDNLQDDDYERIFSFIGRYWSESAGYSFVDFIGYIKRMRIGVEQLWTEDTGHPGDPSDVYDPISTIDEYASLEPKGGGVQEVWKAPDFNFDLTEDQGLSSYKYPTSHVALSYDILNHPDMDAIGILSLFYLMAPIHLVLERFVGTVYATETTVAGLGVQVSTIPEEVAVFDMTAKVKLALGSTVQVSSVPQENVHIPQP